MKRLDLPNRLTAAILAVVLSLGAVGCLVSAYDFQVTWGSIVGLCLLGAALGAKAWLDGTSFYKDIILDD